MRVPDEMLDCIVFLCVGNGDSYEYGGTAFIIGVPSSLRPTPDGYGYGHMYLVTARHNIELAKARPGNLFLRVNVKGAAADYIRVDSGWLFHPNAGVDIAVRSWNEFPKPYDFRPFSVRALVNDEAVRDLGIGVGDELLITGLFTRREGSKRNLPIVRTGVIAAMPHEQLRDVNTGFFYDAYLAEVRSLGGLSGSPVFFLREMPLEQKPDEVQRRRYAVMLLGMVRGHWDTPPENQIVDFAADELAQVNMGIALITPSQDIAAVINDEHFVKERKRMDQMKAKQMGPTLDSAFGATQQTKSDHPITIPVPTRKNFMSALKKATTRRPSRTGKKGRRA